MENDVLIVGAGPVGLTLAAELARHGVRPRIIDKQHEPSPFCRAIGVTPRTLEVWEDMGVAREMIDAGLWFTGQRMILNGNVHDTMFDVSAFPYGMLGLPQNETERILAHHLDKLGVTIERGVCLESFTDSTDSVNAALVRDNGVRQESTFRYIVGCDGAHSTVRRSLDIPFEGDAFDIDFMLGDVHIDWDVQRGMLMFAIHPKPNTAPDMFLAVPLPEMSRYRVSMLAPPEWRSPASSSEHGIQSDRAAPKLSDIQTVADRMLPTKITLSDLRWSSLYRISMRLAAKYRVGNAFIAGDAAHIHPPTGGQGMNTGIQDAYNLAWKLALVLKGQAPDCLLSTYEAERRPVGEDVIARTTRASVNLNRGRSKEDQLAETQLFISYRECSHIEHSVSNVDALVGPTAGDRALDCHGLYRYGVGHPVRLFDVIRGTEHVLLVYCLGDDPTDQIATLSSFATALPPDEVIRLAAIVEPEANDSQQLPRVPVYRDHEGGFEKTYGKTARALLIRPDGHLAWRGESLQDKALASVLKRTFTQ